MSNKLQEKKGNRMNKFLKKPNKNVPKTMRPERDKLSTNDISAA